MSKGVFFYYRSRSAFTLIELLVVIAIIAILAVVVIVVLNPAALLQQSRDSNRLSDAAVIKSTLGIYSEDVGGSLGSSSIVYLSIPDPLATSTAGDQCQGLGLPSAGADTYQCPSSSTYRSANGTGWIPVNLKSISIGSPISVFPVDPVNTTSSGEFYTYETNGTTYETTMSLESQKYAATEASDGGQYYYLYEQGTNLTLAPEDFYGLINFVPTSTGLLGYWNFDEGSGTTAYDTSGNSNNGTWNGSASGTTGYYSAGEIGDAGYFNGVNNYVDLGTTQNWFSTGSMTVSAWVNSPSYAIGYMFVKGNDAVNPGAGIEFNGGQVFIMTSDGSANWLADPTPLPLNQWVYVVGIITGNSKYIYVNGQFAASGTYSGTLGFGGQSTWIGAQNRSGYNYFYPGKIDDLRVYNRVLSATEIQNLYNEGR